ncbi:helix-turn-helix transcriptional regulator [Cohnella sp. JJ-181]|uniref:helix-turn-helix transcriptional regulator n=1 Tax=Cohnella rhizoplanae TaxID=2974897 RepID=UPI0022FF6920|nr:helix-turn-helix transcriptional regulator [Cohnella sp. JJ-181]CAI6081635.1 hypothetical protein COHCIP112018_03376 [Cohnella sp. JJ-181]
MTDSISYTTEEIARLLKISKLTVYDLIKKGELPSYRVGKQMRVDAADLEAYKLRMRSPAAPSAAGSLVITGQDISLELLAKHLEGAPGAGGLRPLRAYAGSLDSLVAMYRGEADIVSTHLYDGDSGRYNLPYIRRILIGAPYMVIHLLGRMAGLYVREGNPLGLSGWCDLGRPGLRLANRERGAGARVLLEEQLRVRGIRAGAIAGYDETLTSHMAVAARIAAGDADFGVGIEKAAALVGRIEFIPLIQESYDLVVLKTPANLSWIEALLGTLRSEPFKRELAALSGYDLSRTGEIIHDA